MYTYSSVIILFYSVLSLAVGSNKNLKIDIRNSSNDLRNVPFPYTSISQYAGINSSNDDIEFDIKKALIPVGRLTKLLSKISHHQQVPSANGLPEKSKNANNFSIISQTDFSQIFPSKQNNSKIKYSPFKEEFPADFKSLNGSNLLSLLTLSFKDKNKFINNNDSVLKKEWPKIFAMKPNENNNFNQFSDEAYKEIQDEHELDSQWDALLENNSRPPNSLDWNKTFQNDQKTESSSKTNQSDCFESGNTGVKPKEDTSCKKNVSNFSNRDNITKTNEIEFIKNIPYGDVSINISFVIKVKPNNNCDTDIKKSFQTYRHDPNKFEELHKT